MTVSDFEAAPLNDVPASSFNIYVEGDRTSAVQLSIVDGLPNERRQVVEFPGGNMVVVERYSDFQVSN